MHERTFGERRDIGSVVLSLSGPAGGQALQAKSLAAADLWMVRKKQESSCNTIAIDMLAKRVIYSSSVSRQRCFAKRH